LNAKRSGGLSHNPLLTRTDRPAPATGDDAAPVDTASQAAAAPNPGLAVPPVDDRPSKFTFYFTPQQLERLDTVWEILRRRGRGRKYRPSKSQFVRVALDRLLDDFERDPEAVMNELIAQQER
jgi:hypothetical protein